MKIIKFESANIEEGSRGLAETKIIITQGNGKSVHFTKIDQLYA